MGITKKQKQYLLLGIFSAFIYFFGMRFLLVEKKIVHYHANFATYIDGTRDELDNFTFYEEVAACSANGGNDPKSRVHLHDQNPYIVHVHDSASTWGHLMSNLGYNLTDNTFTDRNATYIKNGNHSLSFLLNGRQVKNISNLAINSEDVLLIDYSDSNEATVLQRYDEIPKNAPEFNQKKDPASCAGGQDEGFVDRLKRTIGIE